MDIVLFGPPKDQSHWLKDIILSSLLVALLTALFLAYKHKKRSEEHLQKMMKDMDSLAKAERALQDMQSKLEQKDAQLDKVRTGNGFIIYKHDGMMLLKYVTSLGFSSSLVPLVTIVYHIRVITNGGVRDKIQSLYL